MKKLLVVAAILVMALVLTACSSNKPSSDPLVAKWVTLYNDGNSKVLFSFESVGDLDIVTWHKDSAGEYTQGDIYVGAYSVDKDAGTITYTLESDEYVFNYTLEDGVALTIVYGDTQLKLDHAGANNAID